MLLHGEPVLLLSKQQLLLSLKQHPRLPYLRFRSGLLELEGHCTLLYAMLRLEVLHL